MRLYKPKTSNNYWVRHGVPVDVQQVIGRTEHRESTGTPIKRLAKLAAALKVAHWERQYEAARLHLAAAPNPGARGYPPELCTRAPVLTPLDDSTIQELCHRRFASWLSTDDEERSDGLSNDGLADLVASLVAIGVRTRSVSVQGRGSEHFADVAEEAIDWAATLGRSVSAEDRAFGTYVAQFARYQQQALQIIERRNNGDGVETPAVPREHEGQSLSEVLAEWETAAVHLHPKTKNSYKARFEQFLAFLERGGYFSDALPGEVAARRIQRRHVHDFVQWLLHKVKLHPGSISDGHIPALRAVFANAKSSGTIDVNPCDGVTRPKLSRKERIAREEPRHPFAVQQLNVLFASSWYGGEGPLPGGSSVHMHGGAATYWVPLILLFHGFRPVEACQLMMSDVIDCDGLLCFRVTDDGEGQTAKNVATIRGVPVHRVLNDLGFVEYVRERRASLVPEQDQKLFAALPANRGGANAFGQAFNRYLHNKLQMSSEIVLASFRHCWEDARRDAMARLGEGWPKGMHFQLAGRADIEKEEGSAAAYGKGYRAPAMKPYLDGIDYPGLELPMTWPIWRSKSRVPRLDGSNPAK